MPNTIDITKILQERARKNKGYAPEETWEKGFNELEKIGLEKAGFIVEFIVQYIEKEVGVGLGVIDAGETIETPIFDRIDDIYRDAASSCYFCAGTEIDPNEVGFTKSTKLCPICRMKLANVAKALGIETEAFSLVNKKNKTSAARVSEAKNGLVN